MMAIFCLSESPIIVSKGNPLDAANNHILKLQIWSLKSSVPSEEQTKDNSEAIRLDSVYSSLFLLVKFICVNIRFDKGQPWNFTLGHQYSQILMPTGGHMNSVPLLHVTTI